MMPDICALVRRDHDDLDGALRSMVDTSISNGAPSLLFDLFELALAVHVVAEATVYALLLESEPGCVELRRLAEEAHDEHAEQQRAAVALSAARPGGDEWYARALELRVLVVDHATRAELVRWTLQDHVPLALHHTLASRYATERLRVLARTSPVELARAQLAASPA